MDTSLLIWKPAVAEALRGREVNRPDVARSSSDPLSRVWEDTSPELWRLAAALGMRRDQIEDVLQDVWVTARQKSPAALEGDELRRWLYRVTGTQLIQGPFDSESLYPEGVQQISPGQSGAANAAQRRPGLW